MPEHLTPRIGPCNLAHRNLTHQENPMTTNPQIKAHYGQEGIYDRILAGLREVGIDPASATIQDLAPVDQFHTGGFPASRSLADRLEITPQTRVFEAGCGIGGAARFLAKTYGCTVVGMDLAEDFVAAAGPINDLLGLADLITCQVGDVTDTGLASGSFDLVWSQNVLMNVEGKAAALREAYRLLAPGGIFALQAVMEDAPGDRVYPLPWAPDAAIDFLTSPADFQRMAVDAGFTVTTWEESRGKSPLPPPPPNPSLTFSVIMHYPDFGPLLKNYLATAEQSLVVPAVALLTK
jgi:MPBQ/MSBQ methyltransferase